METTANSPDPTPAGVTILVVEDSPTQLDALRFLLEGAGFSVVAATNGKEGLAAVKANAVDLVISDIVMPEMDGFALCKALRADETLRDMPVILLTSLADPRDVIRGLESGANNFICKPYDHPALLARVRNVLANQELRKTAPSEMGISIFFAGQRFLISADRLQILDLLLSTYENAVERNSELTRVRDELRILNDQLEARVAERTAALAERAKELKCLYAISSLVAMSPRSINESLKTAVDLIPPGWQYPEITRARIVFEGQEFPSAGFRDTAWKQSADIVISGETVGIVDVCYLEQRPALDEGPFLKEERDLIIDVARQLGVMIGRKRAEEALGASRTRYFELYDLAPVGYLTLNEAGLILEANLTAATLLGVDRGALVQQPLTRFILSADQDVYYRHRKQLFETRAPQRCEVHMLRSNAAPFWVALTVAAAQDTDGSPVCRAVMSDITERKQAEQTLRHSEERFRLLFERAADSIFLLDIVPDGIPVIRDTNSAALRLLGYEREELIGQPLTLIEPTHDIAKLADARRQGILSGAQTVFETSHRCKDGTIREFECSAAEIQIGSETFAISVERDVTGRKQVEAERENMTAQLRQAQKMEAVGQLAGGMAHDFNNALTVILGFAELASRQLNLLDPLHHHMNEIMRAVDKSANLTRQLLAFARRQIVTLQVLDLNAAIASLANMLPRLIGEDVELRIAPGEGLWNLHIDPSQVDQILMNLVTNARDAIADTGAITIETANVALDEQQCRRYPGVVPGDYVALTVSDTGAGMDRATMERIFDPFFTTKPEGKGTGLGLATVYGVAKQSGGFVHVYSEPGQGTMFKVYLPRFVGDAEQPVPKKQPAASLRGTETVLIVEDEPLLIELIQEGLQALGYDVLAAGAPGDAILLCETCTKEIHVLVSDVVMPMMNGKELQQRLERIRPGLRTIFMSGYTADVVAHRGIVEERMPFVQKPFTVEALAGKIREVLED